jgi:FkbM family methyltransferase
MNINSPSIIQCASLGSDLADRVKLGLFGFVAPLFNTSGQCKWRRFSRFIPHRMWLKPKKLGGLQLLVDPTDWSQTIIFDEIFLRSSYNLDKVTFVPDVVIDCGAHIGMFSLLSRNRYQNATLVAYEPNAVNGEFIRHQIVKNNVAVSFNACAVSTESAELSFVAINSHGGRLVDHSSDRSSLNNGAVYTVQAIDFPSALRAMQMDSLLLKMDVEGAERKILPMIVPILPRKTALFFETHDGAEGWSEIEALLIGHGFAVEQTSARGLYFDGFASRS